MELAGKYIPLLHRGMNAGAVISYRLYNLRILSLKIIGMNKIYIRVVIQPLKQASAILKFQGIPANMRDF